MKNILSFLFVCLFSHSVIFAQLLAPFQNSGNEAWGYEDLLTGEVIIKPVFEKTGDFEDGLAPVKLNGKWGIIKSDGAFLVEPKYDGIRPYHEGYAVVCNACQFDEKQNAFVGGSFGYVDYAGAEVISPQYASAADYSEGLAAVSEIIQNEEKTGYINYANEMVIDFLFTVAKPFKNSRALVKQADFYGYIDKNGTPISDTKFDYAESFHGYLARFQKDGKWGLINEDGEIFLAAEYDIVAKPVNGLGVFCKGCSELSYEEGKYGIYNSKGSFKTAATYRYIKPLSEDVVKVTSNDGQQIINIRKQFRSPIYGSIDDFIAFGYIRFQKDGLWGMMNTEGIVKVEPTYQFIFPFKNDVARAIKDNKVWEIRKQGRPSLTKENYEHFKFHEDTEEGYAIVCKNGNWSVLDYHGQPLINSIYQGILPKSEGSFAVKLNTLWGYTNEFGEEIIAAKYTKATFFKSGKAKVMLNGAVFLIDQEGRCVSNCGD